MKKRGFSELSSLDMSKIYFEDAQVRSASFVKQNSMDSAVGESIIATYWSFLDTLHGMVCARLFAGLSAFFWMLASSSSWSSMS